MKITLFELKVMINDILREGTIDIHPVELKPGDVLNGREVMTVDQSGDSHVIVTYDDGGTVRLKKRNLTNRQVLRVERPNTDSSQYLPKIPAGWGKK